MSFLKQSVTAPMWCSATECSTVGKQQPEQLDDRQSKDK